MIKRVLLVGENRDLLALTGRLLRRGGYQTELVIGLKEAREVLLHCPKQLVVMDCELPDGDAMAACRAMRQQKLPVKILLISSNPSDELRAFEAGADDFVRKPYHVDVLLARMNRLSERI